MDHDDEVKLQPLSIAERLAGAVLAILLGLAAAMVLWLIQPRTAHAEPVTFECVELATTLALVVDFRDAGADLARTIQIARRDNANLPREHLVALEREIRRVWSENRSKADAVFGVYNRCRAQMGDMGAEG